MLGITCCLLLSDDLQYMDTFQFDFERHNSAPSWPNTKFFPKSHHGQFLQAFESTITIQTTTITPKLATPAMRPSEYGSFTVLYCHKHLNIYFWEQKTTTLTIYAWIEFASLWIAQELILRAVSNCFG